MRGRPTRYTRELAAQICLRVASGKSLRSVCSSSGMPPEATVRSWARANRNGFAQEYRIACACRTHLLMEEIIEIADGCNVEGGYAALHRARVQIDARKWLLARMQPFAFGLDSSENQSDQTLKVIIEYQ